MKSIAILISAMLALSSCKNNDEKSIPDPVIETSADSIKKDTIAFESMETVDEPDVTTTASTEEIKVVTSKEKPIKVEYASFGSKFVTDRVLTKEQMLAKYKGLKKGDTVAVKFKSNIKDVCKKKGCWMKMDLADQKESFVRFTDYGFFVPLNADNSEAIVSGRAFLDVISVDELKHYAKDGGESQEAIDKITTPKVTYAFQADGVLIEE
ncbi:MAG TPA: DUF4920 domain-containing protein [Flavobacterium sp.]|jgi:hypothetical protein